MEEIDTKERHRRQSHPVFVLSFPNSTSVVLLRAGGGCDINQEKSFKSSHNQVLSSQRDASSLVTGVIRESRESQPTTLNGIYPFATTRTIHPSSPIPTQCVGAFVSSSSSVVSTRSSCVRAHAEGTYMSNWCCCFSPRDSKQQNTQSQAAYRIEWAFCKLPAADPRKTHTDSPTVW